jgi:hypothetical protein
LVQHTLAKMFSRFITVASNGAAFVAAHTLHEAHPALAKSIAVAGSVSALFHLFAREHITAPWGALMSPDVGEDMPTRLVRKTYVGRWLTKHSEALLVLDEACVVYVIAKAVTIAGGLRGMLELIRTASPEAAGWVVVGLAAFAAGEVCTGQAHCAFHSLWHICAPMAIAKLII